MSDTTRISFCEEAVLNPSYLPDHMKGWRKYRLEYDFEGNAPEGSLWLPPDMDFELVETALNCLLRGVGNG